MRRDDALRVLADHCPDDIVVPVFQAAFDWLQIRPHPLNYLCTGAMGQAASHALGLALGRPDKRVVVLDGDGSLLMNLGALVTVANMAPANLYHLLCFNGLYEVNGRYPIPGAERVDFPALARAAGYPRVYHFAELDAWRDAAAETLTGPGPVFVTLAVTTGAAYPRTYETLHSAESRAAFRDALRSS